MIQMLSSPILSSSSSILRRQLSPGGRSNLSVTDARALRTWLIRCQISNISDKMPAGTKDRMTYMMGLIMLPAFPLRTVYLFSFVPRRFGKLKLCRWERSCRFLAAQAWLKFRAYDVFRFFTQHGIRDT